MALYLDSTFTHRYRLPFVKDGRRIGEGGYGKVREVQVEQGQKDDAAHSEARHPLKILSLIFSNSYVFEGGDPNTIDSDQYIYMLWHAGETRFLNSPRNRQRGICSSDFVF